METKVNVIPATIKLNNEPMFNNIHKRRVVAYARVSTDSDEQETSFEAQNEYYTNYINSRPDWTLISIYSDEGISGTNTKKRDGFNKMISDALDGKFDLIITKSVSRFARNTVDSLTAVRNLKAKGVECYFEKEGIWTFDGKGEVLITIMSSLAQEESRSISENVTWGKRREFEAGKVSLAYSRFLGYEKGENGRPKVVPKEAETVRLIYKMFLDGDSFRSICRKLEDKGILSPSGKENWSVSTIKSILKNEKYKGDARLQKTYTVDYLEKVRKTNNGEVPQYYVENSHPPIVRPEVFDLVQNELSKRQSFGVAVKNDHFLRGMVFCGECGGMFGTKTWGSNTKYRRVVWQCNEKYKVKGKKSCITPFVKEEQIKAGFIWVFNQLIENKENYIADFEMLILEFTDTKSLESKKKRLIKSLDELFEMLSNIVKSGDAESQRARYLSLSDKYEKQKEMLAKLESEISELNARKIRMDMFLNDIKKQDCLITDFDEAIWKKTIDRVVVYSESKIVYHLKDGSQMEYIGAN